MSDMESRVAELLKAGVGDPPQRITAQAVRRQKARRQVIASLGAVTASVAVVAVSIAAVAQWAPRASQGQPGSGRGLPIAGQLEGVDVLSARDAWAVGEVELPSEKFIPLIVHWDGTRWRRAKAPAMPYDAHLYSVAGTSPDDVWAVGLTSGREHYVPVIMHWNGQKWRLMHLAATRPPGGMLYGVVATSASNAWAVGGLAANQGALIMHWNGSTWTQVPTPGLGRGSSLGEIAATSANNAWAVGSDGNRADLILHWNGTKWTFARDQRFIGTVGVAAVSARSAWAVGQGWDPHVGGGVGVRMIQWNGAAWQAAPGLSLARGVPLSVVGASSATNVWAAGTAWGIQDRKWEGVAVVHWNGRNWSQHMIPELPQSSGVNGLDVISADDVWAVGFLGNGAATTPEIMHWNGTSWERAWGSATTGGLGTGSCGPFQTCSSGRHSTVTPEPSS
jgi:hypothetical protein